jgi:hypothetical protein
VSFHGFFKISSQKNTPSLWPKGDKATGCCVATQINFDACSLTLRLQILKVKGLSQKRHTKYLSGSILVMSGQPK